MDKISRDLFKFFSSFWIFSAEMHYTMKILKDFRGMVVPGCLQEPRKFVKIFWRPRKHITLQTQIFQGRYPPLLSKYFKNKYPSLYKKIDITNDHIHYQCPCPLAHLWLKSIWSVHFFYHFELQRISATFVHFEMFETPGRVYPAPSHC